MGFEAILTGHRPVVFGQPFYAGWGLSDDRKPVQRRQRKLTRVQLFAGAMILYPKWYDPYRDRLCTLEDVIANLSAQTRSWREDHLGWTAYGMRRWKRPHLNKVFGQHGRIQFHDTTPTTRFGETPAMIWASKAPPDLRITRVEDGFIRSRGEGAKLVPPLSLVCDDLGIYYDPRHPSRLEELIEAAVKLPEAERARSERLIKRIVGSRISKYNALTAELPPLPAGRRILVPGQVADDASVMAGATKISSNRALLEEVRAVNPAAVILYKPHPDVEAGLRDGALDDAGSIADVVLGNVDPISAIDACDEVWTMTSTLGFEALLRGKRVVCLGTPFYAGWGLTDDRAMPIPRRAALPDLVSFVHAVLIDYPRYYDPETNLACPVEVTLDRLESNSIPPTGALTRLLSKLQGRFANYAHLWRR